MSEPIPITDLALTYLVRQAEVPSGAKAPLLLLLHGVGSNERDLFTFADYLDPACTIISIRAPREYVIGHSWFDLELAPGRFEVNHQQIMDSCAQLIHFIDAAIERYDADPQRVLIGGFSQGAIMSLLVGLTQPQRVSGVVCMSGCLTPDIEPHLAPAEALAGMPILMTHGVTDGIIPISFGRHTRDILEKLPVKLSYHEFGDMGHEVNLQSLEEVLTWTTTQLAYPWHSLTATAE